MQLIPDLEAGRKVDPNGCPVTPSGLVDPNGCPVVPSGLVDPNGCQSPHQD